MRGVLGGNIQWSDWSLCVRGVRGRSVRVWRGQYGVRGVHQRIARERGNDQVRVPKWVFQSERGLRAMQVQLQFRSGISEGFLLRRVRQRLRAVQGDLPFEFLHPTKVHPRVECRVLAVCQGMREGLLQEERVQSDAQSGLRSVQVDVSSRFDQNRTLFFERL